MRVRFLSEFRTTQKSSGELATESPAVEPKVDERRAAEVWTFERPAASRDANWMLVRVEPAEA